MLATCWRHVACRDTIDLRPTDTRKIPLFSRDDTICGRGIVSIACRYARLCARNFSQIIVGDMSATCRRHVAEIRHNWSSSGRHQMSAPINILPTVFRRLISCSILSFRLISARSPANSHSLLFPFRRNSHSILSFFSRFCRFAGLEFCGSSGVYRYRASTARTTTNHHHDNNSPTDSGRVRGPREGASVSPPSLSVGAPSRGHN
jgi:hypothetical protein